MNVRLLLKILPYKRLTLFSRLSPPEIAALFGTQIEPLKWLRFGAGKTVFQGEYSGGNIKMRRIITYRNSFLPVITGRMESAEGGSTLRLTMQPALAVSVCMAIWFGFVLLFLAIAVVGFLAGHFKQGVMILAPLGMLAFGVALVAGAFWFEARKQQPLLLELFQAQEISPAESNIAAG